MTAHLLGTARLQPKGRIGLPRDLAHGGTNRRLSWVQVLEPGHLRVCQERPDGHCWPATVDDRNRLAVGRGIANRLGEDTGGLVVFCQHGHDLDVYAAWRFEGLLDPDSDAEAAW